MFLKSLKIFSKSGLRREITFKMGINLIVDETLNLNTSETGNNVGKTTVLKLIDFCLGGDAKEIYTDFENKKKVYKVIKDFLIEEEVLIELILTKNFEKDDVRIERNFLSRKNKIIRINNEKILDKDFENELKSLIFPDLKVEKPTFRQVISHNIRYKDNAINNTLKNLDVYTKDEEYETLYLYLLGCKFTDGNEKLELLTKINQEKNYKIRLEKNETKTGYQTALKLLESNIDELDKKKKSLSINENFEKEFDELKDFKIKIHKESSSISNLELRENIILEAVQELTSDYSNIDVGQLRTIYDQATQLVPNIQKTFEELLRYHNSMIEEKRKFIEKELPDLTENIKQKRENLKYLLNEEKKLANKITETESFNDIEIIISELNDKYRKKGEYQSIIAQIEEIDYNIREYSEKLTDIDRQLFSEEFREVLNKQINKFNKFFSEVSKKLYDEEYLLKYDIETTRTGKTIYKFNTFNANMSSGKKQGEILSFDIAYTLFADSENLNCLHFLLNDKKELMHDNQLIKLKDYIIDKNIQFIASILKDKLPEELNKKKYIILELSQNRKLFKI